MSKRYFSFGMFFFEFLFVISPIIFYLIFLLASVFTLELKGCLICLSFIVLFYSISNFQWWTIILCENNIKFENKWRIFRKKAFIYLIGDIKLIDIEFKKWTGGRNYRYRPILRIMDNKKQRVFRGANIKQTKEIIYELRIRSVNINTDLSSKEKTNLKIKN